MPGPVKKVTLQLFADTAEGQRKLDDIFAKAEELGRLNPEIKPKIDKAAVTAGLAVLRAELKDTGRQSDDLSGRLGKLGTAGTGAGGGLGSMLTPMSGLIGAGVALSPVVATLGVGLGGLGVAAAGTLAPLLKAAQASGGLQKNMAKLDPEQQAAARSLLGLGKQYDAFEKALQPEVLGTFNTALKIGGSLMRDAEPVAAATGKAFNTFLGQFGATLQDSQWRSFWSFMATTAPGDVQRVGKVLIDLTNTLPPLLKDLQGFASVTLQVADDTTKLVNAVVGAHDATLSWEHAQEKSTGSTNIASKAWHGFAGAVGKASDNLIGTGKFLLGMKTSEDKAGHSTTDLSTAFSHNATQANAMGIKILAAETNVKGLSDAQSKALDAQLAYGNSLITSANDAVSLHDALVKSHDEIGLHTQAQRNSFATAQTYIGDLENQAKQAIASGHGADAAARAITNGLPALQHAKSGSREYWQEVKTLVGWLHQLERIHAIHELIRITGTGNWSATAGELPGQPGKHFVGRGGAEGMLVSGGTPGKDSVPILAMPGEALVPTRLVPALAPFLAAQGVPGFAAGGIVPSYSGTVPGLQAWGSHNFATTQAQVANSIGNWLAQSFAGAVKSASGAFTGAVPNDPLQQVARSMLGAWGWGGQWPQFNSLVMAESGWNVHATNPSSGAYGIPQALPGSKMATAGLDWRDNGVTQLRWMMGYIRDRWHDPAGAWRNEMAFHWYDDGKGALPPGISIAGNGTGRPEPVGGGGNTYIINVNALVADRNTGRLVVEAIKKHEAGSGAGWRK